MWLLLIHFVPGGVGKLQSICSASAAHLMQLAQEWENHRIPLIEKYRSKKLEMSQVTHPAISPFVFS